MERGWRSVVEGEDQDTHLVKIRKKKVVTTKPYYWATRHGNVPAVRACLESGVDVNKVLISREQDSSARRR